MFEHKEGAMDEKLQKKTPEHGAEVKRALNMSFIVGLNIPTGMADVDE